METSPFDLEQPCELNEEQRLIKADLLTTKLLEIDELELKRKRLIADFKAKQDAISEECDVLAREVRTRIEYRLVSCRESPDYHSGRIDTLRMDTGDVASSRPMRPEERQQLLPNVILPDPAPQKSRRGRTKTSAGWSAPIEAPEPPSDTEAPTESGDPFRKDLQ